MLSLLKVAENSDEMVRSCVCSTGNEVLTGSYGEITTSNGTKLIGHTRYVHGISADRHVVSVGSEGYLFAWDLTRLTSTAKIPVQSHSLVTTNADLVMVSDSLGTRVQVIDLHIGKPTHQWTSRVGCVFDIGLHGTRAVTVEETMRDWDLRMMNENNRSFSDTKTKVIRSGCVSADLGTVFFGYMGGGIDMFDTKQVPTKLCTFQGDKSTTCLSMDGDYLVDNFGIWCMRTGRRRHTFQDGPKNMVSLKAGRLGATTSNNSFDFVLDDGREKVFALAATKQYGGVGPVLKGVLQFI